MYVCMYVPYAYVYVWLKDDKYENSLYFSQSSLQYFLTFSFMHYDQ